MFNTELGRDAAPRAVICRPEVRRQPKDLSGASVRALRQ